MCADGTSSNLGGWGYGGVRSGWILKGVPHHPLCGCCAAQPNFAALRFHTALMSNFRQRFLNLYIAAGRQRCTEAKTIHGRETREARTQRSLGSAKLAVLEAVGYKLGFMNGTRTRGRKSDRMAESYPELQELLKIHVKCSKTG